MKTIVIAPHPDDEVLGVGGTLLRRKAEGARIAWLIVTAISVKAGWSEERVKQRADEIRRITEFLGFDDVFELKFPTTLLKRCLYPTHLMSIPIIASCLMLRPVAQNGFAIPRLIVF